MEVPLVLLCAVVWLSLFPLISGEIALGEYEDTAIDESSPSTNNIMVHNTFHLSPMEMEMRKSEDMIGNTRVEDTTTVRTAANERNNIQSDRMKTFYSKDTPTVRTPLNERNNIQSDRINTYYGKDASTVRTPGYDRNNFQSDRMNTLYVKDASTVRTPGNDRYNGNNVPYDRMKMMEYKIDSWAQKNSNLFSSLAAKIDRILVAVNLGNEKSSPKAFELMDTLEIMNKLNNIDQHIRTSNVGIEAKQSDISEVNRNQAMRNYEGVVDQVLTNSIRTTENLEKVYELVQEIDERTIRIFDRSCRQVQQISKENRLNGYGRDRLNMYAPNKCSERIRTTRTDSHNIYDNNENTYENLKKDRGITSPVIFEPQKFNCHDLQIRQNGVYKFGSQEELSNEAGRFFYERYCDFYTAGGAWTVIQRRFSNNNPENFNRTWMDYKLGFGDLDKEFWFGNDFIHKITSDEDVELRIDVEDMNGNKHWAKYSIFKVDSEEYNYNLKIGGYRGSIGGFIYHNDQEFSTYDRQNDNNDNKPCASSYGNGWWFNNCSDAFNQQSNGKLTWENWLGSNSLKSSKMMVRPKGLWHDENENEGYVYTSTAVDVDP